MRHFSIFSRPNAPSKSGGWLMLALALAGAAACATPPPPAEEPTASDPPGPMPDAEAESMNEEPAPAEPPAAPAEERRRKPFDDMDPGEKMNHMKTVIMPAMKTAFQEFDAKEFAEFSCVTCHGPEAKNGKFDMPNPALPPLNEAVANKHPAMTKFMSETVVPQMADMLGETPYDHATGQGSFGCMKCHTEKK